MTATGQPCSSANSRNAAHAFGALRHRADRIGRHQRDTVVHLVRDHRVAEAEPLLVVAEREVRERVRCRSAPRGSAPAPATSDGTTTCGDNRRTEQQPEHRQRDTDADREHRRRDQPVDAIRQRGSTGRRTTGAPTAPNCGRPAVADAATRHPRRPRAIATESPTSTRGRARGAPTTDSPVPRSRPDAWRGRSTTSSVEDGLLDVEALHHVPATLTSSSASANDPRVALTAAHTAREEQEPDTAERDDHRRGLRDRDRREPAQCAESVASGNVTADARLITTGDRDRGRGDPPRTAAHGGHVADRTARSRCPDARRPRRRPRRLDPFRGRDPFEQRALGKVAHPVPEPGVQLGPGFELDPRTPQPVHVHRREPGPRFDRARRPGLPLPQLA